MIDTFRKNIPPCVYIMSLFISRNPFCLKFCFVCCWFCHTSFFGGRGVSFIWNAIIESFIFIFFRYSFSLCTACCYCFPVTKSCLTLCTAAHQASLSFTISRSLLKFMPIESVMLFNHLILCCHLLLLPSKDPASGSFPMSQFFASGGQRIGASASASLLPMNIQGWFPLGLTGLISLLSKGLQEFSPAP